MKSLIQRFRDKYKVNKKDINSMTSSNEKQEDIMKDAVKLAGSLKGDFLAISYSFSLDSPEIVNLTDDMVEIIEEVLNTENEFIKNNEFFLKVKDYLQEMIDNRQITLNEEFYKNMKTVEMLHYDTHRDDREFWENMR